MSATDFKTLQTDRRNTILTLIAAAETAAVSPHDYGLRAKLRASLDRVTLQDIIMTAQDGQVATRFYKAARRLVLAQNTHPLKRACAEILALRSCRWLAPLPDTTHKRTVRQRADIHA